MSYKIIDLDVNGKRIFNILSVISITLDVPRTFVNILFGHKGRKLLVSPPHPCSREPVKFLDENYPEN